MSDLNKWDIVEVTDDNPKYNGRIGVIINIDYNDIDLSILVHFGNKLYTKWFNKNECKISLKIPNFINTKINVGDFVLYGDDIYDVKTVSGNVIIFSNNNGIRFQSYIYDVMKVNENIKSLKNEHQELKQKIENIEGQLNDL